MSERALNGPVHVGKPIPSNSRFTIMGKDTENDVCIQGWCIFTTLMLLCTLKSNLAMFSLYFFMDMNYLLLGIAHIQCNSHGEIPVALERTGGIFGILAASSAWYNAFAAISDINNSFLIVPVGHFPWSTAAHLRRVKAKEV